MPSLDLRAASWILPWLAGLTVISYLGGYKGGRNVIPFWWDIGVVAIFSLAVFAMAYAVRLEPERTQSYIANLDPEEELEEAEAAADAPLTRAGV
jgi:hypothetical protein